MSAPELGNSGRAWSSPINAHLSNCLVPIYTGAKGAVVSLIRSLAHVLAADGIRVNSVSPGQSDTRITAATNAATPGRFERRIMVSPYGGAQELASVIRVQPSREASYVNASEIIVDGGNIASRDNSIFGRRAACCN